MAVLAAKMTINLTNIFFEMATSMHRFGRRRCQTPLRKLNLFFLLKNY